MDFSNFDHISSFLVKGAYEDLSNYLVRDMTEDGNYVVVYCSSNGIYFPNTKENFLETMIDKNRFEWNDKKYDMPNSCRNIYLRDVFKQWYIKGLNTKICNIDKIIEFIKNKTKGKKIITIGSSSGGYLATIIGCKLNASHVFNFSGQFDLNLALTEEDRLLINQKTIDSTYFNIVDLIKKSKCNVFYFNSRDSKQDIKQLDLIKNIKNIHILVFPGDIHGVPIKNFVLRKLINTEKDKLLSLCDRYKNVVVNSFHFELDILGKKGIIIMYLEAFYRKMIKSKVKTT